VEPSFLEVWIRPCTASPSHSVPTVIYKNSNGSVSQGTSTRASAPSTQGTSIPPTDAVIGDNTTPPDVTTAATIVSDLNANASTPTVDTSKADGASLSDCKLHMSIAVVATAGLTLVIGTMIACFVFCIDHRLTNTKDIRVPNNKF